MLTLTYTLCFLTRYNQVLMLQRRNPPNQGLWNGVGGRIEAGESPFAACLREVQEESGYRLRAARFAGVLTWRGFEIDDGGLYLFTAEAPVGDPAPCAEGTLRWQTREWVLSAPDVVSNIRHFAPHILSGAAPVLFHFDYDDGVIAQHEVRSLPHGVDVMRVRQSGE